MMLVRLKRCHIGYLSCLILAFLPIWIDTGYGILSYFGLGTLKISMLYRLIITSLIFLIVMLNNSLLSFYIKVLLISWALLIALISLPVGDLSLVNQINHILRLIYPFGIALIALITLQNFDTQGRSLSEAFISGAGHYGWVFGVFLIISFITGMGLESYGDHAFGIKSFYIAGNDTGLAALIALTVLFSSFYYKTDALNALKILSCLAGLVLLGTKAGWGGAVIMLSIFTLVFVFVKKSKGILGGITKTAFIGVISGLVISASILITENFDQVKFQLTQIQKLLEGKSPRQALTDAADQHFLNYPDKAAFVGAGDRFNIGVGEGYYLYFNNIHELDTSKLVEHDWYDTRGHYGVPFALLVALGHLFFLILAFVSFIKKPSVFYLSICVAISIYLGHALLAGHAFYSMQPSGVLGILYGVLIYNERFTFRNVVYKNDGVKAAASMVSHTRFRQ